jgi:hypothetical protein
LFGKRRLERFEARQEATLEQVGHITAALIVREPGTALSANAYDGLRKQVSIAARDRRQHLARLVELWEAIDAGATTETLRRKCEQWCAEVGLEPVTDPARGPADWFRIVEGDGPEIEVLTPAWADTEVGHLVQRGTARRFRAEPEPAPEPEAAPEAEVAAGDGDAEAAPEPEAPAAETEVETTEAAMADAETTEASDVSTAEDAVADEAEPTSAAADEAEAADGDDEEADAADGDDEEADEAEPDDADTAHDTAPADETEPASETDETTETEEAR